VPGYEYYSGGSTFGGSMPKVIKTLILINIGVFLLQIASGWKVSPIFGLSSQHVFGNLMIWQLFTYMFLHGGVLHLVFNMFILWMFGRELEEMWGEKGFLRYYLTCGIGAGIVTCLFTLGSPIITIGASGAVFGILIAYAVIYPERPITLLIFFIIPVTLKAKHLVTILIGMEFLFCIAGTADGIGHFAHIGGAVIGYVYLKIWKRSSSYDYGYKESFFSRLGEALEKWKQKNANVSEEEVDRILDKISKNGIKSLSWRERLTLRKRAKK